MATTTLCGPSPESALSSGRKFPTPAATVPFQSMLKCPLASLPGSGVFHQNAVNLSSHFCGFSKYQKILFQRPLRDHGFGSGYVASNVLPKYHASENIEAPPPLEGKVPEETSPLGSGVHSTDGLSSNSRDIYAMEVGCSEDLQVLDGPSSSAPSLCIAVIGATGELARNKVFPALFALYYSGYLPKNVGIFGYSRKNLTDEDLRSIIAGTLTCRVDHEEGCENKTDAFLNQTYHINGGFDNKDGMAKLNARMQKIEGHSEANRIFYLSVPQEALLDVASSLAEKAQSRRGWNRIIIEKPFGFDLLSSFRLTQALLSKFEEKQIYRIDHLLGRNIIENLTVLRFSNLVFEPLWSRSYIRNVQVILSEDWGMESRGRYFDVPNGYGIIRDIVHSHILQTIALFAMEPPVSLDGEDIRNEKVKVLRSIRKLELDDIVLGQYKSGGEDKADVYLNTLTPTFFAAALYIDNARWDGVPFLIKAGMGLIKHRVEIRIQFRHVPGNLYRERIGQNIDLATNELILRDAPDEAILVKVNNKVPGLEIQLDASELNLLYKDKYDIEVPDSYEHLLLDVIDGDSHLFMRSDELATAWNILTPVLDEIDQKRLLPELYEFGGRGPVGAYYLGAKHGVRWADE
ncbi:inactive glucose-6-phosphate 1-dehydrogenase 4, chloroplastic isoform X1 [Nymphaea colorata]|nr:inactive glucose-6-phosphate 1-dehydrogenase 4, chloroplastic isoform X1 [Nymphaea colorata]